MASRELLSRLTANEAVELVIKEYGPINANVIKSVLVGFFSEREVDRAIETLEAASCIQRSGTVYFTASQSN